MVSESVKQQMMRVGRMSSIITDISWDMGAIFRERPNRFVGIVDIPELDLKEERIHVHDPGRLTELLFPGNRVLLKREDKETRKTKWDLIAARWEDQWILVHSGYHRAITESILSNKDICPFGELVEIKSEVKVGRSRMDFLVTTKNNDQIMVEVKGCTLTQDGIALFPDAPTERGKRHLETLTRLKEEGMRTAVIILVFRKDSQWFQPNQETDLKFAEAFYTAMEKGVEVYPLVCSYENKMIIYHRTIPVLV